MHTFTRASFSLSVEVGKLESSLASSLSCLGVDVRTHGLVRLLSSGETIGELSDSNGSGTVAGIMLCKAALHFALHFLQSLLRLLIAR